MRSLAVALIPVVCVVALAGCYNHTGRVRWDLLGTSSDGRTLYLRAIRGECGGKAYARVEETSETVTVRVFQHTHGAACNTAGVMQNLDVHLRTPLDGRALRGCSPYQDSAPTKCAAG